MPLTAEPSLSPDLFLKPTTVEVAASQVFYSSTHSCHSHREGQGLPTFYQEEEGRVGTDRCLTVSHTREFIHGLSRNCSR